MEKKHTEERQNRPLISSPFIKTWHTILHLLRLQRYARKLLDFINQKMIFFLHYFPGIEILNFDPNLFILLFINLA